MISLKQVSRLYQSGDIETTALNGVSLDIDRGEFVAIMGPSGCGKSTLLNVLGMIDRPSEGEYLFEGEPLRPLAERDLAKRRRDKLGFVFQSFNLIDELTIADNIELALVYRGWPKPKRREAVAAAMDRVGISHRAAHYPHQLSGGQQQRAAVARAIVGKPALLLADEPTGNLDTENGRQVMDLLRSLNSEGASIIMVTHSPEQAALADRVVLMRDGQVQAEPSATH